MSMVTFATQNRIGDVRKLWKDVFADSDQFLDLYFTEKLECEQCLICVEGEKLCASLQMLPYTLQLNGASYPACYIYAVMTARDERHKGYMRQMLLFAFDHLSQKKVPLVFLIPQEPYLFDVYKKFRFEKAFLYNKKEISLPPLATNYFEPDAALAYQFYCKYYKNKNVIFQSFEQFDFLYKTVAAEGGSILAVGKTEKITGLCFCIKTDGGIRTLDFLSNDEASDEHLKRAIYAKYKMETVVISRYGVANDFYLGMCRILNEQILTLPDLEPVYLNFMMNE